MIYLALCYLFMATSRKPLPLLSWKYDARSYYYFPHVMLIYFDILFQCQITA